MVELRFNVGMRMRRAGKFAVRTLRRIIRTNANQCISA
jgi:hypothetical protein